MRVVFIRSIDLSGIYCSTIKHGSVIFFTQDVGKINQAFILDYLFLPQNDTDADRLSVHGRFYVA